MIPVFAATSSLMGTKSQTLKHGAFLLEWVIQPFAGAETVTEVLVIFVGSVGLLGMDTALGIGCRVQPKRTWAVCGQARCTTIACEVTLSEDLDELVLPMALYGASVANTSSIVRVAGVLGWRIAGQARENVLAERSEIVGAVLDALRQCQQYW